MSLSRFKKEDGTTIIEVVVVMAIIAILSGITLTLVTSLFDSSLRTSKYLDQNTRIENMYGFFASRMASTNIGSVGLAKSDNTIDPLTLAGDQFVYQSNGGGSTTGATLCYRVMYFKNNINNGTASFPANSIWLAVANDCTEIRPTAGPNQSSSQIAASNDPVLDPSSGNPKGSPFMLASGIAATNSKFQSAPGGPNVCGGAGPAKVYTEELIPFAFCNVTLGSIAVADTATPSSSDSFYSVSPGETAADKLREIRALQLTTYVESSGESSPVPIREYTQVFSLAQVCATETQVELTLPEPQGWRNIQAFNFQNTDPGAWIPTNPSFNQYWEASSLSQVIPAFYKDSATKRVYFRGAIKRTSDAPNIGLGTSIFSLPAGSTPPPPSADTSSQIFLVPRGVNGGTASIEIRTSSNGIAQVIFVGASNNGSSTQSDTIYLDGISFRVS